MADIVGYAKSKGWKFATVDSDKGKELKVRVCPFCHDDGSHFYMNTDTGFCYCHKCGNSGGIFTIMKMLGDLAPVAPAGGEEEPQKGIDWDVEMKKVAEAHRALLNDKDVLRYLWKRHWAKEAVEFFMLGLSEENGTKWLWYPYFRNGKLVNVKMRSLPPKEKAFKRLLGGESALYNMDALTFIRDIGNDYIIVTEGESDCIALWSAGFPNVVAVTVGAKGIKAEWIHMLDKFGKVYLAYDTDIAGKEGASKMAKRLGYERCYWLRLPPNYKDVNEYFSKGHSHDDFKALVEKAERFDVENVRSIYGIIQDSIAKMYVAGTEEVLAYPWPSVNKLTGGMSPGDLIVIAGRPGVGKTTFALQLLSEMALKNVPSLLYELEMRPERIMPRIIGYHLKMDSKLVNTLDHLQKAQETLKHIPLYIAYQYKRTAIDSVADTIRMCVQRYGIQFLVFDNLHFLVRGDDDLTKRLGATIQEFKLLAEELAIPLVAIARPRKSGAGKTMMDSQDLAWSGDIEGDADMVLIVHRDKRKDRKDRDYGSTEGIFDPETTILVDKCRWNVGGMVKLVANDALARFDEQKGLA